MSIENMLALDPTKLRYLNLGCGARYSPQWVNVDFVAHSSHVLQYDLRNGIPFPDSTFEVVYHSHMLEHLSKESGVAFLQECRRVLTPGGTLRVVVPDLEQIARLYLYWLERALQDPAQPQPNYDWMVIEMYDQTVREFSGGEHGRYLTSGPIPNKDFVLNRMGGEIAPLLRRLEQEYEQRQFSQRTADSNTASPSRFKRFLNVATQPKRLREAFLHRVLKDEYRLLEYARFRRGGEIHLWMYDRYSLGRALGEIGMAHVQQCKAQESRIPQWSSFHLDSDPDGAVYKPDSLFIEATK